LLREDSSLFSLIPIQSNYCNQALSQLTGVIVRQGSQIDVENRAYHYLSQSEIGGGKRISQHLSGAYFVG